MTPYYADDWLTVYHGDARAVLAELEPESVHCVVTSPPYWGLRDYGTASWEGGDPDCAHAAARKKTRYDYPMASSPIQQASRTGTDAQAGMYDAECPTCGARRIDSQLGLEPTPEEYVENMVAVFREVRRVLRSDGTVWLNLGDSYASGEVGRVDTPDKAPGLAETQKPRSERRIKQRTGLKPKDLVGIPWRVAFALQADGWYLRSAITWCKANPMPESVADRPTNATEMVFLLSKSARYFYDQEAVRESSQSERQAARPGGATGVAEAVRGVPEGQGRTGGVSGVAGGASEGTSASPSVLLHRQGQGEPEAVSGERQGQSQPRTWSAQASWFDGDRVDADGRGVGGDQDGPEAPLSVLRREEAADDGPPHTAVEGWTTQRGERGGGLSELQQREGQSVGRNLRNWWVIPTQPWKGAHFATFPRKLVEPCIKAGTSEKGVCPECGAPWVREVERTSDATQPGTGKAGQDGWSRNDMGNGRAGMFVSTATTTGWRPSCGHGAWFPDAGVIAHDYTYLPSQGVAVANPVPATVLDPFAGSGTTGMVAQSLSRRAVLIDLSMDYLGQLMDRNRDIPLGLGA